MSILTMQALLTWHIADSLNQASLAAYIEHILGDMRGWTVYMDYSLLQETVERLISAGATVSSAALNNLYVLTPAQFTESMTGYPSAADCFFSFRTKEGAVQCLSQKDFITWAETQNRGELGSEVERCWAQLETVAEASIKQVNAELAGKQAEALGLKLGEHLEQYIDSAVQEGLERLGLGGVREVAKRSEEMAASIVQLVQAVQGELAHEADLRELNESLSELERRLAKATPLQVALGFTAPTYFLILRLPAFFQAVEVSVSVQPRLEGVPERVVMTEELAYIPTGLTLDSVPAEGACLLFQPALPQCALAAERLPLTRAYLAGLTNIDLQKDFTELAQQQAFLLAFADMHRATNGPETPPPLQEAAKLYFKQPTITVEEALHRFAS